MDHIKRGFLILFLCFLNINEVKSQNYIPMLNDSLYWDVAYYDSNVIICSEFGNQGSGPYRYAIDGDTIINGTDYKKFKSYSFFTLLPQPSPNCSPFAIDTVPTPSWNVFSYLREDTTNKKVYRYDVANSLEYLWYDFDAQVGDTLSYPELGDFRVDTIYYIITLDGITRKFFGCNGTFGNFCAYYIEGLGGKAGPFHEPFGLFELGPWLMCISDFNQNPIYGSFGVTACYNFTTNLESFSVDSSPISMFPNPADNFLHFENLPPNTRIKIVDNYGNIVKDYQDVLDNKISISSLNSGMYFVHFRNNSTVLAYKKFIKIR